jgi:hypothetical protein
MGNYSQHENMIIISAIKGTTESEIIISPPTLKEYLEIDNSQTTRGSKWIMVMMMEMVLILVMMVMERPPPTPRRRDGEDGGNFPPSPGLQSGRI